MKKPSLNPDQLNHKKWCLIADKVEGDPEILSVPIANIERWKKNRMNGKAMLERWRSLILSATKSQNALSELLQVLRDDGEEARHLKSYSPFPGVLTSEEVDQFTCAWRH